MRARAHDRLSQRPSVNRFAAIVCIATSGDHRRNDRLSMARQDPARSAVNRAVATRQDQHGQLRLRMAIFDLAGSSTSRIGKANLATLCRFSGQEHAGGPVANWQCGKLTFSLVVSRDEPRRYFCAATRWAQSELAKWQSDIPAQAKTCRHRSLSVATEWQDAPRASCGRRPRILEVRLRAIITRAHDRPSPRCGIL